MYLMNRPTLSPNARWLRTPGTRRQAIITRAEEIDSLKKRCCESEAADAEHDAIEMMLHDLSVAVVTGASRAEVIELLNTSIDFCATHFADEETFMRKCGRANVDAHSAAHRRLLAKFVRARRGASGEGLSLSALNELDLLHAFHRHVAMWDKETT